MEVFADDPEETLASHLRKQTGFDGIKKVAARAGQNAARLSYLSSHNPSVLIMFTFVVRQSSSKYTQGRKLIPPEDQQI